MPRHRGTYKPEMSEPYELGRSRLEAFIKCPGCFWLDRAKGVKFPDMPGWTLNTATDTLLKKDFDKYRILKKPHPLMIKNGLKDLVPYDHEDFHKWTQALTLGFRTYHEKTNIILGGGLDDVWINTKTQQVHIVDYKSTATGKNDQQDSIKRVDINDHFKSSFRRQMDIYQFIMKNNNFDVSNTGYFLYVNADQHFEEGMLHDQVDEAVMKFRVEFIEYKGDSSWVEETLIKAKECLLQEKCPKHAETGFGRSGQEPCHFNRMITDIFERDLLE
tara:strand:- start:3398 stop:4219 length:822 start_codon:yes stop_codon:yes gene_type:complete